jgi:hypothetical protein
MAHMARAVRQNRRSRQTLSHFVDDVFIGCVLACRPFGIDQLIIEHNFKTPTVTREKSQFSDRMLLTETGSEPGYQCVRHTGGS